MFVRLAPGFLFLYILVTVVSFSADMAFMGQSEFERFNTLAGFNIMQSRDFLGVIKIPLPNPSYFTEMFRAFTWNFAIYQSTYGSYFRALLLLPVSAWMTAALIQFLLSTILIRR